MTSSDISQLTTRETGSPRDFCWHDDFSSPRPRLSVRLASSRKIDVCEEDDKTLNYKALSVHANCRYNCPRGGRFAALGDHRTPMRAPNELGARVARTSERFNGSVGLDLNAVTVTQTDTGSGYSEAVFRYFLEIERRRSNASGQPFLLLVISSVGEPADVIPSTVAEGVFDALASSVRDTDFVGWYSQGKAIGAVLIQSVDLSRVDAAGRVSSRLSKALAGQLPPGSVEGLRFRLCQICADREVWS